MALYYGKKTSKHHGEFYCLNNLQLLQQKTNVNRIKKLCKNKDFCQVIMPSEDTKILKLNQYQKYDKSRFIKKD